MNYIKPAIKSFGEKDNGNGVFIDSSNLITVVYGDGFFTDFIVVYDYDRLKWAGDATHSKTTIRNIEKAIRFANKRI